MMVHIGKWAQQVNQSSNETCHIEAKPRPAFPTRRKRLLNGAGIVCVFFSISVNATLYLPLLTKHCSGWITSVKEVDNTKIPAGGANVGCKVTCNDFAVKGHMQAYKV